MLAACLGRSRLDRRSRSRWRHALQSLQPPCIDLLGVCGNRSIGRLVDRLDRWTAAAAAASGRNPPPCVTDGRLHVYIVTYDLIASIIFSYHPQTPIIPKPQHAHNATGNGTVAAAAAVRTISIEGSAAAGSSIIHISIHAAPGGTRLRWCCGLHSHSVVGRAAHVRWMPFNPSPPKTQTHLTPHLPPSPPQPQKTKQPGRRRHRYGPCKGQC